jgi:2-iminobutanoate/2-iminopropanoate deaminase
MLFTGAIMGADPSTGRTPEDAETQTINCFKNLELVLAKAGAVTEDVGFITVFLREASLRARVNVSWLEMFPNEDSRPARHTIIQENLPYMIQIEAIANIQSRQ